MANMGYRRSYQQQQGLGIGNDPFWVLLCAAVTFAVALAALPWMIIGFTAQRLIQRWLHWKLSFLLWFVALFVGAFILYQSYQHGLQALWTHELTDTSSRANITSRIWHLTHSASCGAKHGRSGCTPGPLSA
jgi:hypothetical protein